MRNLFIFGLLVILLVAAQYSSAQTVDDIINKYIDARGGKDKLDAIKSIYMEGSRQMMDNEITIRVTKEQGKLSRTEFDFGGNTGYILVTDKAGWVYIPMRSPTPDALPADAVASMQVELDIAGPLVDYAAKGNKAELLGKDTLNGNENCKIKLTTAANKEIIYWIDAKTYLVSQSSAKSGGLFGGQKNNSDQLSILSDYSAVDGVQFPHTIETKTIGGNQMGNGSTTFDKIVLNQPIDAKLYLPNSK